MKNKIKCLQCGMILESKHVHDFQMCSCSNETFVDGGDQYQRVGGHDLSKIEVIEDGDVISNENKSS